MTKLGAHTKLADVNLLLYKRCYGGFILIRARLSILVGLLLAAVILAACNSAEKPTASGPVATTSPASAAPASAPQVPTVHADGVRRVTTVELRDLLAQEAVVVVDVRDAASFKQGHIRGAKLIPVADVLQKADGLPRNKLIVTYCS